MRKTKRILGILLSCMMLLSMLSVGAFAAAGDQDNPINANDKWFGYGADCFLLNPALEANDADGVWYELTADANGILHLEHSYKNLDYSIYATVNGVTYEAGSIDGVSYNRPIATYPVAVGDVITIQVIARDTTQGGSVYLNAKFITGGADTNQMVKVKTAPVKLYVAAGQTVYFQDDSLNAEYAAKYVNLTGDSVEDVTLYTVVNNVNTGVVSTQKGFADEDEDGAIEALLGGSEGSAGAPAVKPAWAIENNSGEDRCFVLTVVDDAHECVYDDAADADCNTCGAIREIVMECPHEYVNSCDSVCALCGDVREISHDLVHVAAKASTCQTMGNLEYWYCDACGLAWLDGHCGESVDLADVTLPVSDECVDEDEDGVCDGCHTELDDSRFNDGTLVWPCQNGQHQYEYECSVDCAVCGVSRTDAADHEFFNDCETVCMICFQEVREASHNVTHVEAVAPTCTELGNLEYWCCDVCGMAWLDADCIMNTNRFAVILPMTEHTYDDDYDADCNECGDVREVPEKPVGGIVYGDADGDGQVTSLDAIAMQQYVAGVDVTLDLVSADADGDGQFTSLDVILMQQYIAGWEVTLGPV